MTACAKKMKMDSNRALDALKIIVMHTGLQKRFDDFNDMDRKNEWAVANQGRQVVSKNDDVLKLGFLCREMYYDSNLWVVLARNPSYFYFGMLSYFRDGQYARRFFFLFEKCSALFTQSTLNYFITECFNYMFRTQTVDSGADRRYALLQKFLALAEKKNYEISYWAAAYYYRRQMNWFLLLEKYSLGPHKNLDKYYDEMMILVTVEMMKDTNKDGESS